MQITELLNWFKKYFLVARWNKAKSYTSVLSTINLLTEYRGAESLRDYTRDVLEDFLTETSKLRCWSSKTYRNHWQNLKSFFVRCEAVGYVKSNPVVNVSRPKLDKPLPRFVSEKDIKTIIYETEYYPWRYSLERSRNSAIIFTLLLSWIRLQEMLNLTTWDVDFWEKEILVRKWKWNKDRIIPINQKLLPRLKQYHDHRNKKLKPSQRFFTSVRSGKQLTQKNIATICQKIRCAAWVYFSPHMLRHTFARMAIDAQVNLFAIKEVMWHADISTTQRYLSISKETLKRQISNVNFFIWH